MIVNALNNLIAAVGKLFAVLINLLPNSPFNYVLGLDYKWVDAINWIFPLMEVIAQLQAYVAAVAVYYVIRVALRWIKLSEG